MKSTIKQQITTPSSKLISPKRFEFEVSIPVQDTVTRFQANIRPGFWSAKTVKLVAVDDDTYEFQVEWGVNNRVLSLGYLNKQGEATTLVTGETGVDAEAVFSLILCGVATLIFLGIGVWQGSFLVAILGGGIMIGVGWLIWRGLLSSRDALVTQIEDALRDTAYPPE